MKSKIIFAIVPAVLILSCGKTAKVGMIDGRQFTGEIVAGDRESITLRSFGGSTRNIAKDSIGDIDHPGNGLAVTGGCIGGYFVINYIAGLAIASAEEKDCEEYYSGYYSSVDCTVDRTAIHIVNLAGIITGISMFSYGLSNWNNSVKYVKYSNLSISLIDDRLALIYRYRF